MISNHAKVVNIFSWNESLSNVIVCSTRTFEHDLGWCGNYAQCLKIIEKVAFNITSKASYVYILSGQKFIKNTKKWSILASFLKTWSLVENVKIEKIRCDFLVDFQTLWFGRERKLQQIRYVICLLTSMNTSYKYKLTRKQRMTLA